MRRLNWQVLLGLSLVFLSAALYLLHFAIFRDAKHIFIYLVGDIAFVPIEVLLVTIIIHRLLTVRERRERLEKLNVVIGAFFSEVGTKLLAEVSSLDPKLDNIRRELIPAGDWSREEFARASDRLRACEYGVELHRADLEALRNFLHEKRQFLLQLMQNPNLLEHESFTDLLQSVFHLTEELVNRGDEPDLPPADYTHLAVDVERVYRLLAYQWLLYMRHLREEYPYLYSLAMRVNPFDRDASLILH